MAELAQMILAGELCEDCGCHLGDEAGFPRTCVACGGDAEEGLFIPYEIAVVHEHLARLPN